MNINHSEHQMFPIVTGTLNHIRSIIAYLNQENIWRNKET